MTTMDPAVWRNRFETDLMDVGKLRWILDVAGVAAAGEDVPNMSDREAYATWLEDYTTVRLILENALGGCKETLLKNSRYKGLGDHARILDRIKVLHQALVEHNSSVQSSRDVVAAGDSSQVDTSIPEMHTMRAIPSRIRPAQSSGSSSFQPPRKRSAPSLTPLSPSPQRTGGLLFPAPTSTSSIVYHNPDITYNDRQTLYRKMKCGDKWGHRCCRCGFTNVLGTGHMTHNCTAERFCVSAEGEPVNVDLITRNSRHLFKITGGPMEGEIVCYQWNISRTKDGLCYLPDCPHLHRCSLCLSTEHRALDCLVKPYIPTLPPRPPGLPPAKVAYCPSWLRAKERLSTPAPSTPAIRSSSQPAWTRVNSSQSTRPHSSNQPHSFSRPNSFSRPSSYKATSSMSARLAQLTAPASRSSRTPRTLVTASPSPEPPASRFKVIDQFFSAKAQRSDLCVSSDPKTFISPCVPPAIPTIPLRRDKHSPNLIPQAQSYPIAVPQYITPRTGYRCRIEQSDLIAGLSPEWAARLLYTIGSASQTVPLGAADLAKQQKRDNELWDIILTEEEKSKVEVELWENVKHGKVGRNKFQPTDGDTWNAGLVILANYPPIHESGHAFTSTVDGTRMLGMDGLQSPSLSGNFQLAFSDLLPAFFAVRRGGRSLTIQSTPGSVSETTAYPDSIVDSCIEYHANDIISRLQNGSSQFHFVFGANPSKVHAAVVLAAGRRDDIEQTTIQVECRIPRVWETGAMSLETLLLAQNFGGATKLIGKERSLFNDTYLDKHEKEAELAARTGTVTDKSSIIIDLILLSHANHPDRCMVLVKSGHMTAATSMPLGGDERTGPRIDMITTLLEDVYFARLGGILFPRPSWKFTARRIQSQLDVGNKVTEGQYAGLGEGTRELLKRLNASRTGDVNAAYLPPTLKRMYEGIELRADPRGVEVNPLNVVDRLLVADDLRVKKMAEVSARKP